MNVKAIREILENTQGRFFTVEFIKKDGTLRKMNCRAGVQKFLKGGDSTVADRVDLFTVYDVVAKGYRNINIKTIQSMNIDGTEIRMRKEDK